MTTQTLERRVRGGRSVLDAGDADETTVRATAPIHIQWTGEAKRMEHTVLADAGEDIQEASDVVHGTTSEKLRKHARRVSEEARTAEPDSDALRRHRSALADVREEESVSEEVAELVESAREKIGSFLED